MEDPVALSKRIGTMKLERSFKREDTYTLDAQATIDFNEKVGGCGREGETEVSVSYIDR